MGRESFQSVVELDVSHAAERVRPWRKCERSRRVYWRPCLGRYDPSSVR